ncbi:MAG: hypothetical protein O9972_21995 [Burkholderiales bacterium]|jgi:hypothetical protein|nr:hypothetical protein [Burkholderiales bacterium]
MAAAGNTELGHEGFMSADDLRAYMTDMEMAKASKAVQAMDSAEKARLELVKRLSEPLNLTPEVLQGVKTSLLARLKKAAENGETELMVMRFPVALCSDHGRAINNSDPDWPDSLEGRPRQAYELWRDHLRGAGFRLKAMIIEWPGGLPGDVGFFLNWGKPRV